MFPVKWALDIRGAEQHQEDWNPFKIHPADWSFCLLVKQLDPVNSAFSFYHHTFISVTQSSRTTMFPPPSFSAFWCLFTPAVGDVGRPVRTESQSEVLFGKDQQHLRVMTTESRVAAAWDAEQARGDKQQQDGRICVFTWRSSTFSYDGMFSTIQAEVAL